MSDVVCSYGTSVFTVPVKSYPSGEPLVTFPTRQRVDRIMLRPKSMLELMGGLWFVDALIERGNAPPDLILPFVPGARQDRLNDSGDYLFTAKSVAREVNLRDFRSVTVIDPHSEVISGFINRCHVIHAHECFPTGDQQHYSAIVSPDAGAEKRAGAVAKKLGLPLLHGWKTRNVLDGSITGFGLEPSSITGKYLVVDDICDGGGTFVGLAGVLKERGLKADLFTSHGLYTKGTHPLLCHYEKVICTDSVEGPRDGVVEVPMCESLMGGSLK